MLRWGTVVGAVLATVGLTLALPGVVGTSQAACTRTYRGDLVLEGNERLVITEGVLCVGGNIILRDNARLEISDATLRMTGLHEGLFGSWAQINVYDASRLTIRNSPIETPGARDGALAMHGHGASQCEIEGVSPSSGAGIFIVAFDRSTLVVRDSRLLEVRVKDRADVSLVNSQVDGMVDLAFTGAARVELSALHRTTYSNWRLEGQTGVAMQLSLQGTSVGGWSIEIFDQAQVAVADSTLTRVILAFPRFPTQIQGIRPGQHSTWELRDALADDANVSNLVLTDTWVGLWTLFLYDGRGESTFADSHFNAVHVWDSSVRLHMDRTVMDALQVSRGHLRLVGAPLTLQGVELSATRLEITGEVSFRGEDRGVFWDSSSASREYEVQVRDNAGNPARGVRIGLEDPNGRVSHRTTDQEGVVRFTIWFYNTNYDHTWHLLVPQGDTTARVPITLLTSTPVQVTSW